MIEKTKEKEKRRTKVEHSIYGTKGINHQGYLSTSCINSIDYKQSFFHL